MKIVFLTMEITDLTGGCLYDGLLYHKLVERFGEHQVKLIVYDDFENEFHHIKREFVRRGLSYRKHSREILDGDYVIINTTSYKILTLFPWHRQKRTGAKFIGITHHLEYMEFEEGSRKWMKHKLSILYTLRHMARIITPNIYTKDCLKTFGLADRTTLIEAYLDNTVKEGIEPRENVICFVGAVSPRKGLIYGIRAFAQILKVHPEYEYHIAGSFHEGYCDWFHCDELLKLVEELGIADKVKFLGRVSDEEKNQLYAKSKLFLFPSQLEGYGWVMVEAMGYGLPVVAFDNTAMPYTVNESNGAVVPNKDVDAMAEAVIKILDDPDRYDQLSEGAKQTVRNLPDRETIDREYEELMDEMEKKLI